MHSHFPLEGKSARAEYVKRGCFNTENNILILILNKMHNGLNNIKDCHAELVSASHCMNKINETLKQVQSDTVNIYI